MSLHHLPLDPLNDLMRLSAEEGGITVPDVYADDGRPLWSIEALAVFLGKL